MSQSRLEKNSRTGCDTPSKRYSTTTIIYLMCVIDLVNSSEKLHSVKHLDSGLMLYHLVFVLSGLISHQT